MYTCNDVAELFGTTRQTIEMLRYVGVLPAIKIGKRYMYSQYSIEKFQRNYEGMNLSNANTARESLYIVDKKLKSNKEEYVNKY